jgi:hypothetical protein
MNHNVTQVEQHPSRGCRPLRVIVDISFRLQRFDDGSVNGLYLPVAVAAADDEVICEGADLPRVQQDYVGGLLVCRYLNNSLG